MRYRSPECVSSRHASAAGSLRSDPSQACAEIAERRLDATARLAAILPGVTLQLLSHLVLLLPILFLVSHARGQEPAEWKVRGAEAALQDAQPAVRIEALKKLGMLKATHAIPGIAGQLNDESPTVLAAAIAALGAMGVTEQHYAQMISSHLRDPEKDVQLAAIRAIGRMGAAAREYGQQIADLLREENDEVRLAAVTTLGAMEEAARDYLTKVDRLREDPNPDVSAAAAVARCRIGENAEAVSIGTSVPSRSSAARRTSSWT